MGNSGRNISNRLRKHRVRMGYTQKEVAKLIGVSNRLRIGLWEQGQAMPGGEHLLKLAVIYQVSPEILYAEYLQAFAATLPIKHARLKLERKI